MGYRLFGTRQFGTRQFGTDSSVHDISVHGQFGTWTFQYGVNRNLYEEAQFQKMFII